MVPVSADDLFALSTGDTITKRSLFDLIQYSKVAGSSHWGGPGLVIGNTPQQGINWIGPGPVFRGVLIKTRPGSYSEDGWADELQKTYRYSFKARKGTISYTEKANESLIHQPLYHYPILLFTEERDRWIFAGTFTVTEVLDTHVVLARHVLGIAQSIAEEEAPEAIFQEGKRRYVAHILAERNRDAVLAAKQSRPWICEICELDFNREYGTHYIEAHHKVPVSTYAGSYTIRPADLALLCANCHRAVHAYMRSDGGSYHEIRSILRARLGIEAES